MLILALLTFKRRTTQRKNKSDETICTRFYTVPFLLLGFTSESSLCSITELGVNLQVLFFIAFSS